jgi:hypothetical protein
MMQSRKQSTGTVKGRTRHKRARVDFVKPRLSTVLLIVAGTVPLGVVVGSGPALAAKAPKPNISCNVTGTATVSPGVSNTAAKQTLTTTLTLSGCTGSSVAGITGASPGTTSAKGKTAETCADLTKPSKPATTKTTISWNNGTTSAVVYKTVLNSGTATAAGKVTSGTFKGGKLTSNVTFTVGAGQNCTSVPITSATISGTFNIT